MLVTLLFICAYLIVAWIILIWAIKKKLVVPVALGVLSRLVLCVVGLFVVLPFGGADAIRFERVAWWWSQGSFMEVLASFDPSKSYLISSITAVFYYILERNLAIPVLINGMLGLAIMYYGLRLAEKTWPEAPPNYMFALLVALHPMLNIHSAIVLRENYILLFLLIACIHLVVAIQKRSGARVVLFVVFVVCAASFHGGMILFALGLPLFFVLSGRGFGLMSRVMMGVSAACVFILVFYQLDLGKVSDIQQDGLSVEYFADLEGARQEADTAYLHGMVPTSLVDLVWQGPIRVFFFLFKPFLWDLTSAGHAVVFLDALLWIAVAYAGVTNWPTLRRNPAALAILICSLVAITAFAYGTGNYGTALRHRTKFLIPLLVVVYPFLPRLKLSFHRRT